MSKNDYLIRLERKEDYPVVENLIRESFWNVYRPGCLEHYLITKLREHPDFVKELDFVMEKDGEIIGQNVFVKANIKADDGRNIPILTMGPICITPKLKRQGYGKILLDYSLKKATELGFGAVCFEGNINFYGKSGFTFASEFGLRYHGLPEGADASFFLCKELIPLLFTAEDTTAKDELIRDSFFHEKDAEIYFDLLKNADTETNLQMTDKYTMVEELFVQIVNGSSVKEYLSNLENIFNTQQKG